MISINLSEASNFTRPEILLHSTIPPSLFGINPRTIEGSDWWNVVRWEAYAENNYCCWACGISKLDAKYHQWLEAHECYDFNVTTRVATFIEVVALCPSCHCFIHKGRLVQVEGRAKILDVFKHGVEVLAGANLPVPMAVIRYLAISQEWTYGEYRMQANLEAHHNWSRVWTLSFEGQIYPKGVK